MTNDGVSTWAQACAQKNVLHVAATHRLVVDVVAGGAVARKHALDGHFSVLPPLPSGSVVGIVKHQLYAGAAGGFAGGGAVKNDVLHGLAAQLTGAAFAQYPTHRVHDVGLSASIWAHHTYQLTGQDKVGGFCKRLKAGEFDGGETHSGFSRGSEAR